MTSFRVLPVTYHKYLAMFLINQEYNARKVNCGRVYSAYTLKPVSPWAEFVNKNRCISVRLVSEEVKSIAF